MSTRTHAPPRTVDRVPDAAASRRRRRSFLWVALAAPVLLVGVGWAGLQVEPRPLPAAAAPMPADARTVPLPGGLPAPVERFYRTLYGERVPVVESAVISGRGTMRISGITFPARFRFSHVTGSDYRHYIETTIFGAPVFRVDEWFTGGSARLKLPFGEATGPKVDQGANLALWAEAVWMPSVWVTDPQASWQPVDDTTARLLVPFGEGTETFTVTFDAKTGLLRRMESMRFKSESSTKTLWINEVDEWGEVDGHAVPLATSVRWADEGTPWAKLRTESVLYGADLSRYVRASGP